MSLEYDTLYDLVGAISERCHVRRYSDKTFCVSVYIQNKYIYIEGHYELVLAVVQKLHWEYKV